MVAALCLFGLCANAQFSDSTEQYPTKDYSNTAMLFPLADVATQLGTDAPTLIAAINGWMAMPDSTDTHMLSLVQPDGTESTDYTADGKGFWMNKEGKNVGYGAEARFFGGIEVAEDSVNLSIYAGQYPDSCVAGDICKATFKLTYAGKSATFAIQLNVIEKPVYAIPEHPITESALNVVASKEVEVHQFPRGAYDSDAVKMDISDAVAALSLPSADVLVDVLDSMLYTTTYRNDSINAGLKNDTLSNNYTAGAPGFWLRKVMTEAGIEEGEVCANGYDSNDAFFIEALKYDKATGILTGNLGQYPGSLKSGENLFANFYLLWGDKAYKLTYKLIIDEKEQGNGVADLTMKGEETVTIEQAPASDYGQITVVKPDMTAIAAALGCEVANIGLNALDDSDNWGNSTANNGGWWLSAAGLVVAWGDAAYICVEPDAANDYSKLNVQQFPNHCQIGDEYNVPLYFLNGDNYYKYTINLKIVAPTYVEHNFESVATRTIAVQQVPAGTYSELNIGSVSLDDLNSLIGTTEPTLYGLNIDSIAAKQGEYTKGYTCDPKPGFWLTKEGRVVAWGDNAYAALGFKADGTVYSNEFPDSVSIGDVFNAQLFLVNEETDKMVTLNVRIDYVASLVEKTIVGEENLGIKLATDQSETLTAIDLDKVATALEVTKDDLMNEANLYLHGLTAAGVYGEGANCSNGLSFDLDGGFNAYGNTYFYIDADGLHAGSNDEIAEDFSVNIQFCFEVNNKLYVYYAKLLAPAKYDEYINGIADIKAGSAKSGMMFNLAGQRISKAGKGLYIMDGKKYIGK